MASLTAQITAGPFVKRRVIQELNRYAFDADIHVDIREVRGGFLAPSDLFVTFEGDEMEVQQAASDLHAWIDCMKARREGR